MSRELKEKSIRWLLTGVAFVSLLSLACIMLFLFMEGLPLFADYPLWDFLTGHLWYPTSEPPEFGIFPLIMGSLAVTILASCIAVPLGIMTAAYLAEIAARPDAAHRQAVRRTAGGAAFRLSSAFFGRSSSPRSFRTGSERIPGSTC